MKRVLAAFLFIFSDQAIAQTLTLSSEVYKDVPFSSQFMEDGALIRNVNYEAVNQLVPQLEAMFGLTLETRGEAHITVITPPEAQGWFSDHKGIHFLMSGEEIHKKYFSTLQKKQFKVLCVGQRQNDKGHHVFYLVVDTPDLLGVRAEIQTELERRAQFTGMQTHFDAKSYWPHITIGYVKGDVHGVSKGPETCLPGVRLKIR